ncbi:hypothetical protein ACIU1J_27715 [Azospirillum doebereinerae]|uniref:hypothetical protein n=1 Tax=Azospirillum doebereinerae TaxID=92933 RepID=UPI001EE5856B|nr:hypothetical protein [Azospirillum doebereinerae]MCG5241407.1 hypothetical protein [Azospirillum doebereinerae]
MKDLDIKKCLDGRVEAGQLSRAGAEHALKTIRELERKYAAESSPETALSAAIAEAAAIMKAEAVRQKGIAAKQILASARVMEQVMSHPDGPVAGAMALLVRDWRNKATYSNVEARKEVVLGQLMRHVEAGLNAYRSKAAGLTQDVAGMRNVIYELHGRSTGDRAAADFARGWKESTEKAADRYIAGGGDLAKKDDWRHPQTTDARRVRELGRDAWTEHLIQAAERGDLHILDFDTDAPATGLKLLNILKTAGDDILSEIPPPPGKGGAYGRHNERRVFQWQNADAFLAYNDKFGVGQGGLFEMFVGHLDGMARDIALTEILGPKHGATMRAVQEMAIRGKADGAKTFGALESPAAVARTYDVVAGRLGGTAGNLAADIFGGIRNMQTATKMGSAIISAVPSDSVSAVWAAKANGIPAVQMMGTVMSQLNPANESDRAFAMRLGIVSHAIMDRAIGTKRFSDQIVGDGITSRMASFVIRAQGLSAWTQSVKTAFQLEFMGFVADNVGRGFRDVDAPLREMFGRYGISPSDWDVIRAAPLVEHEGARFFDAGNVSDRALGERLMEAMIEERAFAILEPDARVRQITTAGMRSDTVMGQIARSVSLFKSFALTMATTHMARAFIDATPSKVMRYGAFVGLLTLSGAAAIQARQIVTGKDPRRVDDPKFWIQAGFQGGGAGIFGDFLQSGIDRNGQGLSTTLAGPVFGLVDQGARFIPQYRALMDGKASHYGAELARAIRFNAPGGNLWYTRLVADRAIMDTIQQLLDPQYRESFSRMEERARRDYSQQFWFRPGQSAPDRPPDLGAMGPR